MSEEPAATGVPPQDTPEPSDSPAAAGGPETGFMGRGMDTFGTPGFALKRD